MSGHTPGPWKVWSEKDSTGRLIVLEICETEDRGRHPQLATVASYWPEGEANARLIAAAPSLLEALRAMMLSNADRVDWPIGDEEKRAVSLARAAVKAATGEA